MLLEVMYMYYCDYILYILCMCYNHTTLTPYYTYNNYALYSDYILYMLYMCYNHTT